CAAAILSVMGLERRTLTPNTLTGQFSATNSSDFFQFSIDSRLLRAMTKGRLRLWDLAANRERAFPHGDSWWTGVEQIASMAGPVLSPDGRILAGPSTNFTVKLWEIE